METEQKLHRFHILFISSHIDYSNFRPTIFAIMDYSIRIDTSCAFVHEEPTVHCLPKYRGGSRISGKVVRMYKGSYVYGGSLC